MLELRTVGTPTFLECDVPISWLSDGTVSELAGSMLGAYFEFLLSPGCDPSQYSICIQIALFE